MTIQEGTTISDGSTTFIVKNKYDKSDIYSQQSQQQSQINSLSSNLNKLQTNFNSVKRYIKETYVNGTNWYVVYNDGWVRQGGCMLKNGTSFTHTFLKPFANTDYAVYGALCSSSSETGVTRRALAIVNANNPTSTTSINLLPTGYGNKYWVAEGQGV